MPFPLGTVAQQIADDLSAAGIPAVVDARDLQLPGAWVTPATVTFTYLDHASVSVDWDIYLIVRDVPAVIAMDELSAFAETLAEKFGAGELTPQTVNLPNQSADSLPALVARINTTIREETDD